jgi:hypothetical protein
VVKRPLRPFDWLVKVPLGLVWLGVLAILAIPVLIWMTALYYAAARVRGLRTGGGSDRSASRSEAA